MRRWCLRDWRGWRHKTDRMKWLIYLLLLVNLAFGLLHFRSVRLADIKAPVDDDNLRLVLLKEYLARQDNPASGESNLIALRCNTLGPFAKKTDANKIRNKLDELGMQVTRRVNKDNRRKGYWVMIPPANSRDEAKRSIEDLQARDVHDYFLVATGEQVNAVSLGVFSRSELAQRRYDEIKELGFRVQVRPVDLPQREYWLDWPVDQHLPPEMLAEFRERYPGIGQSDRNCSKE